ncbi:GNAT family N-acetyltransferase [Breznakiella homolactica]|uniref:N-acetyltransferase n=1 Tax=Breznakiella homolactica TaxID=2798577 RepID=A0A7T7XN47_9SPIR|nr:GNAT family N-acetyltransferase [Breznakiella homolactica]QQO09404.1 GNAT family N-acetyltransferase [Breznakiella homolactica]
MIRPVTDADAPAIAGIYNYYIEYTPASFEELPLSNEEMAGRIRDITAAYPWFVWEENGEITGYAYAGKFKERSAYRYSVEDSIYLKPNLTGKGIGTALLTALLDVLRKTECHAVISGITLPNDGSVRLHEKFGFNKVAHFKEVGFKLGEWRDVGYWELILSAKD